MPDPRAGRHDPGSGARTPIARERLLPAVHPLDGSDRGERLGQRALVGCQEVDDIVVRAAPAGMVSCPEVEPIQDVGKVP
jgi:hypothetical protein